MELQFLGAAKTVTGSKYLIKAGNKKILIDCGLFQGLKPLRLLNWQNLPIDPASIDCVILSHAHIDHSGYLPLLVKNGFRGKIYCTKATRDLCALLLPDCGYLQEEEAALANRLGYSKHHPAFPLYTANDAEFAMEFFHPVDCGKPIIIDEEISFSFHYAGHILGASIIHFHHFETSLLFSGDLGRPNDPIMRPPVAPLPSDVLIIESTYGNRSHEKTDPLDILEDIINRAVLHQGTIIIPAFAVGRAQLILDFIYQLKKAARIGNIPVYMDSPMAAAATKIFLNYTNEHRLSKQTSIEVCKTAHYTATVMDSKALDQMDQAKIIISASGMATGGRVLHHLKAYLPDKKNIVIFAGFQAAGTRGDRLVRGEKQIKIHGQMISVNAEIIQLNNLSAHCDAEEMMLWLKKLPKPPRKVFITHGEFESALALKTRIEKEYGWDCTIPEYLQTEIL